MASLQSHVPITLPPILTSPLLNHKGEMPQHIKLPHLSPPPQGPLGYLAPIKAQAFPASQEVLPHMSTSDKTSDMNTANGGSNSDDIITLFPRRKAGQSRPGGGRGPVVLTLDLLEKFYGMPLHVAAKRLGICQTAIKKVCRKLGIMKWPYKEMRTPMPVMTSSSFETADNSDHGSDGTTEMNYSGNTSSSNEGSASPHGEDSELKDALDVHKRGRALTFPLFILSVFIWSLGAGASCPGQPCVTRNFGASGSVFATFDHPPTQVRRVAAIARSLQDGGRRWSARL
eukprot:767321-Hanusia_phi.AAC.4